MNMTTRVWIALCVLTFVSAPASAVVEITSIAATAAHPEENSREIRLGVTVTARTTTLTTTITVGAGFTFTCSGSAWLPIVAQNSQPLTIVPVLGSAVVSAPLAAPGMYLLEDFASWPMNECRDCRLDYTALARDGSFTVSGIGAGISFGATVEGEQAVRDVRQLSFCRRSKVCKEL